MKTFALAIATLILCTEANAQTDAEVAAVWRVCQENTIQPPKRNPKEAQNQPAIPETFKPGYEGCEDIRKAYGETAFARHERMLKEKEDTEKARINGLVGKIKK